MNKFKLAFTLILIVNLAACNNALFRGQVENEQLAVITSHHISDGFITFSTIGHGCTFYNNFKIEASEESSNTLKVVRLLPDNCNMEPRDVSLLYSFRHLGLDLKNKIYVKNTATSPKLNDPNIK